MYLKSVKYESGVPVTGSVDYLFRKMEKSQERGDGQIECLNLAFQSETTDKWIAQTKANCQYRYDNVQKQKKEIDWNNNVVQIIASIHTMDNEKMEDKWDEIAERILKDLDLDVTLHNVGIWLHKDRDHHHLHILFSKIDCFGQRWSQESNHGWRLKQLGQQYNREYNLHYEAKGNKKISWRTPIKQKLNKQLEEIWTQSTTFEDFKKGLSDNNISITEQNGTYVYTITIDNEEHFVAEKNLNSRFSKRNVERFNRNDDTKHNHSYDEQKKYVRISVNRCIHDSSNVEQLRILLRGKYHIETTLHEDEKGLSGISFQAMNEQMPISFRGSELGLPLKEIEKRLEQGKNQEKKQKKQTGEKVEEVKVALPKTELRNDSSDKQREYIKNSISKALNKCSTMEEFTALMLEKYHIETTVKENKNGYSGISFKATNQQNPSSFKGSLLGWKASAIVYQLQKDKSRVKGKENASLKDKNNPVKRIKACVMDILRNATTINELEQELKRQHNIQIVYHKHKDGNVFGYSFKSLDKETPFEVAGYKIQLAKDKIDKILRANKENYVSLGTRDIFKNAVANALLSARTFEEFCEELKVKNKIIVHVSKNKKGVENGYLFEMMDKTPSVKVNGYKFDYSKQRIDNQIWWNKKYGIDDKTKKFLYTCVDDVCSRATSFDEVKIELERKYNIIVHPQERKNGTIYACFFEIKGHEPPVKVLGQAFDYSMKKISEKLSMNIDKEHRRVADIVEKVIPYRIDTNIERDNLNIGERDDYYYSSSSSLTGYYNDYDEFTSDEERKRKKRARKEKGRGR